MVDLIFGQMCCVYCLASSAPSLLLSEEILVQNAFSKTKLITNHRLFKNFVMGNVGFLFGCVHPIRLVIVLYDLTIYRKLLIIFSC